MFGRSVRARSEEATRPLPGDALIAQPIGSLVHAITVRRCPADVWPWLAQMGAGSRAGWYSYDLLDNGGRPSATRIVPELQQLSVGMIFPALPGVRGGFTLLGFERERWLILGFGKRITRVVHFIMQRKQLLGIAKRAESASATTLDRLPQRRRGAA